MTEEQQEKAISFALDLLDLVNNEKVVGDWETFICKGASNILIELVRDNMDKNEECIGEFMTDPLDKFKDSDLTKLIWDKFVINAKELDEDAKQVLYDNLWNLYITGEEK